MNELLSPQCDVTIIISLTAIPASKIGESKTTWLTWFLGSRFSPLLVSQQSIKQAVLSAGGSSPFSAAAGQTKPVVCSSTAITPSTILRHLFATFVAPPRSSLFFFADIYHPY
jgi:hypothetical protein